MTRIARSLLFSHSVVLNLTCLNVKLLAVQRVRPASTVIFIGAPY